MSLNFAEQLILIVTPLEGSGDRQLVAQDMARCGSFNVSVTVTRDTADTNVDILVEHAHDGDQPSPAWEAVETTNLAVSVGTPTQTFDKEYPLNRQWMRVKITNITANGLSVTRVIVLKKAIFGRGT